MFLPPPFLWLVDLRRSLIVQRLVDPVVVVKREVFLQPSLEVSDILVAVQIDVFILHATPKTLHEDIVQTSTLAVHRDFYTMTLELRSERSTCELRALVCACDLWLRLAKGLSEHVHAEVRIEGIRESVTNDKAAVPVDHRRQIHEPRFHRHVRNVGAPNLIRPLDHDISKQVRINPVCLVSDGRFGLGINRLQAHQPHQPSDSFAIDFVALCGEPNSHFPSPVERTLCVLLVDQAHQLQVLGRFLSGLIIIARTSEPEQLTLTSDAQRRMVLFDGST